MIKKIIFLLFIVFYLTNANAENLANELKELNKLFKSGQITEEQFKKSKAKLIGIDYKPPEKEPTQTQKLSSNQIADKAKKIEKTSPKDQELINKFANYEKNCVLREKVDLIDKKKFKFNKSVKEKVCPKVKDILKLGTFNKVKFYPEGMLGKSCKEDNWLCIAKKAGSKVYEIFVRRGPLYHARKPGAIIMGMSWYEIMYLNNLRINKKTIDRYLSKDTESYFQFNSDVKKINSLIKMNEGRIKMREALGFSIDDDVEDVIKGQWLLASLLNNDELKVKRVKLHKDIKKREKLLAKYKSTISKYKKKLEEKNN